jgi:hypothetical protein
MVRLHADSEAQYINRNLKGLRAIDLKESIFAKVDLTEHYTYEPATLAQTRGTLRADRCTSCAKGNGRFVSCCSFDLSHGGPRAKKGIPLLLGACGNCYWGGQAGRCSFKIGGECCLRANLSSSANILIAKKIEGVALLRSSVHKNTHIGNKFNLWLPRIATRRLMSCRPWLGLFALERRSS